MLKWVKSARLPPEPEPKPKPSNGPPRLLCCVDRRTNEIMIFILGRSHQQRPARQTQTGQPETEAATPAEPTCARPNPIGQPAGRPNGDVGRSSQARKQLDTDACGFWTRVGVKIVHANHCFVWPGHCCYRCHCLYLCPLGLKHKLKRPPWPNKRPLAWPKPALSGHLTATRFWARGGRVCLEVCAGHCFSAQVSSESRKLAAGSADQCFNLDPN